MKKYLKARKAKGFTLVELLIVLIIIGILAGALLLVAGAGTDKANATKVVSNLRSAKAAALMVYADNNGSWAWAVGTATSDDFKDYMDKGTETDKISVVSADEIIWLLYNGAGIINTGVAEKLVDLRNSGVPLAGSAASTDTGYTSGTSVYMRVN